MSKPKGLPKTGGRQQGTPNKTTSTIRSWIVELINANREQITADLNALEPKERLAMFEKLLPYVLPKADTAKAVEGAAFTKADITTKQWGEVFEDERTIKEWYEQ